MQNQNSIQIGAEAIAQGLGGHPSKDGWMACCPAHSDKTPSLSIKSDSNKVLVKCFAGCTQDAVIDALKAKSLWPQSKPQSVQQSKSEYIHCGLDEQPALKVTRTDYSDGSKRMFQSHMENGSWVSGGSKVELLPYKFAQWKNEKDRWLVFVEGEKCVDALVGRGFLSTTTAGGSNSWRSHYAKHFAGRNVVILPDNDPPGFEYARLAYEDIKAVAASVKILELPGLGGKEDVYDWFSKGHKPKDLKQFIVDGKHSERVTTQPMLTASEQPLPSLAWKELKPLPRTLPEAPALTKEMAESMLPSSLAPWILDIADRLQVPIESVATSAFTYLSSVIGRKVGIFPKQEDSWIVLCILWMALVARPSMKKTATMSAARRPLDLLEAAAREDFKKKAVEEKASQTLMKIKIDAVQDVMKKAAKDADNIGMENAKRDLEILVRESEENKLYPRRWRTSDATVEKLGELINQNPNGITVERDELSGWLKGLDKTGREGEREFYLESWNGTGSYDVDRIGRGHLHIESLWINMVGGIQPGKLEAYVHSASQGGSGDDGLLQRFQLMVYPEKNQNEPNYVDRKPNKEAEKTAIRIFKALDDLNSESIGAKPSSEGGIPCLRFSGEAQDLFKEWSLNLEKRLHHAKDMAPAFEAHLGKYRSLMPALSLLFHLIDRVEQKIKSDCIEVESARMAAVWCDFLEGHAKKVYAIATDQENYSAEALAKKIKAGKVTDGMEIRRIYRHHWSLLSDHQSVDAAIEVLETCNWARSEKVVTDGATKSVLRINPVLLKVEAAS